MQEDIVKRYAALRRQAITKYYGRMNEMQRRAVVQAEGPLLILAGAGSGKTTVLINRIEYMIRFGNAWYQEKPAFSPGEADIAVLNAYLNGGGAEPEELVRVCAADPIKPWNILAITFTNKAADELKNRLSAALGEIGAEVNASTFHSLCVRILRREIEPLGYGRSFTIYDSDDSLRVIRDGLRAANIDEKLMPPRSVLSAISKAKDSMLTPEGLLARNAGDYRTQCVAKVYGHYQAALKRANALDFDDIILLTVRLFQQFPQVLEYYRNRYRYIMVDEYQDTNQVQYLLVSLLAGGHKNLCVVGDDDQSIYKFRGATIENILSFENQFENVAVIRLEQNYRSTQNILSAANAVIANNTARKGKNLWTDAGDGGKIRFIKAQDELEEARLVADEMLAHVEQGGKWSDHAVLYRMNAQSNAVERAMAQRGIPYRIVGGVRFYDRKEIKDVAAYLAVMNNPDDTLRLLRVINEPKRGIGLSTLASAQEIADMLGESLFDVISRADEYAPLSKKAKPLADFARMLRSLADFSEEAPLDEVLDEVLEQTGYLRMLESQGTEGLSRIENVMELKSNILKYMKENPDATLSGFLEEIALYTDIDNYDREADVAILMTIHAAKGLEFPRVTIIGMEEGLFPGRSALNFPEEIEEERRLAYVAITRAKELLTITGAERRMLFGQTMWGRPSRFLNEIPKELLAMFSTRQAAVKKQAAAPAAPQGSASSRSIGVGAAAAAPAAGGKIAVGDNVRHKVFGLGQVLEAKAMGGDTLLSIRFETAGMKKIFTNFVQLEKV
jgi:DNA helicase-2/ATP-dependent DNA helicase PcrA